MSDIAGTYWWPDYQGNEAIDPPGNSVLLLQQQVAGNLVTQHWATLETIRGSEGNTAYGWGNHAAAGYVTWPGGNAAYASLAAGNDGVAAYSWGNHGTAGYVTWPGGNGVYLSQSGGTITGNLALAGVGNLSCGNGTLTGTLSVTGNATLNNLSMGNHTVSFNVGNRTLTTSGNAVTIDLGNSNHQTLFTGNGGAEAGNISLSLVVPPNDAAGTILLSFGNTARNITWTPNAGNTVWLGVQPAWTSVTNKFQIVVWRYYVGSGGITLLSATDTN